MHHASKTQKQPSCSAVIPYPWLFLLLSNLPPLVSFSASLVRLVLNISRAASLCSEVLAAPASSASHRARRLIRTARRWFAAAETAAPRDAPSRYAGWCSLSLSAAAAAGAALQPGHRRLSARSSFEIATASPPKRARCRPPPIPQDGLCLEQLEKSGYSLYFSSACLRRSRGTQDPESAIVHHFTCGTYACFIPKSFSVGGVNLLCQKSEWTVFGFFVFVFYFPILKKKQTNKKNPPPPPLCFLVVRLLF